MVVLTRAPMAPEVASDRDSRSAPILKNEKLGIGEMKRMARRSRGSRRP
jgi:hypothetical protein